MNGFRAPSESLGTLSGESASELLGAVADIALVVDNRGVIRDMSSSEEFASQTFAQLVGARWIDTVAVDSKPKVTRLLEYSGTADAARHSQINQLHSDGRSSLVLYSAIDLEQPGFRLVVGKDLSALERMQQKLVDVQQLMERDYNRLRRFEIRYRILFQTVQEAIVIANSEGREIVEANPAACELFQLDEQKLLSKKLHQLFGKTQHAELDDAIRAVERTQEFAELSVDIHEQSVTATLSSFRISGVSHLMLRLMPVADEASVKAEASETTSQLDHLRASIESVPDALVITDAVGHVLVANTEFLDIAQLANAEVAHKQSLSRWLGHGSFDFQFIMNNLSENGSIRLHSTRLRGEYGSQLEVELSAVAFQDGENKCLGFSMRDVSRRLDAANEQNVNEISAPRSVDQLTSLVGRVPLKNLVRESTEMIEQLCIEAALEMTGNNRVSAAEMLGVSRQSLYVKLRRYSLDGDSDTVEEA